jgi:hypothetical protein
MEDSPSSGMLGREDPLFKSLGISAEWLYGSMLD